MLVSFFQPTPDRHRILMESPAFPSDLYAVQTHLRSRGLDPAGSLVQITPREGEHTIRTEDLETALDEQGPQTALVWLSGVNYFTGQVFDMAEITAAAKRHGCTVGFDLAHAAGNVPMSLHDWDVDFACWCSYKYLNAGPGAVAGRSPRNPVPDAPAARLRRAAGRGRVADQQPADPGHGTPAGIARHL
jgi:kynureninase